MYFDLERLKKVQGLSTRAVMACERTAQHNSFSHIYIYIYIHWGCSWCPWRCAHGDMGWVQLVTMDIWDIFGD